MGGIYWRQIPNLIYSSQVKGATFTYKSQLPPHPHLLLPHPSPSLSLSLDSPSLSLSLDSLSISMTADVRFLGGGGGGGGEGEVLTRDLLSGSCGGGGGDGEVCSFMGEEGGGRRRVWVGL